MTRYTIVAGDFVRTGGMDVANLHLAQYLAGAGQDVHLVAHRVDSGLLGIRGIVWHSVPKPFHSYLLGEPLLAWAGARWGRIGAATGGRLIVNGGNCIGRDTNWVHFVHAAHQPEVGASTGRRLVDVWAHRRFLAAERRALHSARLVIANSNRTADDLVERVGIARERVRTVYYGTDAAYHRPPSMPERAAARAALGWTDGRPGVAFVGALGDRRKGFDVLFRAWEALCRDETWDAKLLVIGAGRELPAWRSRAVAAGLGDRIQFLGFTRNVRGVLWGCDAIAAPARYEAYGLAVHEAVCCGLAAIVHSHAGVAERLHGLEPLQPPRGDDPAALASALRLWRADAALWAQRTAALSEDLRAWSWNDMAAQIVRLMAAT
ncbi:MAG: glycosyltransferase family 4 protein [Gemmatimonadaceae bacterium]